MSEPYKVTYRVVSREDWNSMTPEELAYQERLREDIDAGRAVLVDNQIAPNPSET